MIAPISNTRRNKPVYGTGPFYFADPGAVSEGLRKAHGSEVFRIVGIDEAGSPHSPWQFVIEASGVEYPFLASVKEVTGQTASLDNNWLAEVPGAKPRKNEGPHYLGTLAWLD